jgi:hypothetical protein
MASGVGGGLVASIDSIAKTHPSELPKVVLRVANLLLELLHTRSRLLDIQLTTYVVSLDSMTQSVASVCHRHGAPTGSPSDLEGLLRELHRNKHLAMDFWSMVSQMSVPANALGVDPEPRGMVAISGAAPSARMLQELALEAIVRAVTRMSVFEMMVAGGEPPQAVAHLASLLAGSDLEYDTSYPECDAAGNAAKACEETPGARLEQENPADRRGETAVISAESAAGSAALTAMDHGNEPAKSVRKRRRAVVSETFIPDAPLAPTGDDQLRHIFGPAAIEPPKPASGWPLLFRPHVWLRRRTPTLPQ